MGREVLGFGESKSDNDFAGIFTTFAKSTWAKNTSKKIQNKVDKHEQDEFLKALIWACAGFKGFTEINKINYKMIAHFGKDWGMKKPLLKVGRGFLSYIQLFLIFATKIKKHTGTGMSVRLKENALLKI